MLYFEIIKDILDYLIMPICSIILHFTFGVQCFSSSCTLCLPFNNSCIRENQPMSDGFPLILFFIGLLFFISSRGEHLAFELHEVPNIPSND